MTFDGNTRLSISMFLFASNQKFDYENIEIRRKWMESGWFQLWQLTALWSSLSTWYVLKFTKKWVWFGLKLQLWLNQQVFDWSECSELRLKWMESGLGWTDFPELQIQVNLHQTPFTFLLD